MNYYPDNNAFNVDILKNVSERQGRELFQLWAEKVLRRVYDEQYYHAVDEPEIAESTLGLLSCRKNGSTTYKLVVVNQGYIIDAALMPGAYLDGDAVTDISVKYAEASTYLSKDTKDESEHELIITTVDVFHVKICKPDNACFVCYDEVTERFFDFNDTAAVVEYFFRYVDIVDKLKIEFTVAPHPGFTKLFETCEDVECLLKLDYDISYSTNDEHKINVYRRADGTCLNHLAGGLTDAQVELLLSFTLTTMHHLQLKDAPNVVCTAFLYWYNHNDSSHSMLVPISCHVGK